MPRLFLHILATMLLLALAIPSLPAFAEEPEKKPLRDAPQKVATGKSTTVAVEHEGEDTIGARLAFQLKEIFNTSSLFQLTDADKPKLNVLVSTVSEFPSRPEVGSAYAVVWVYSESRGNLQYYLGRQTGVVSEASVADVARVLAERTDGIAVKYGYLFGN